ncbi:hypothetical protein CEXT_243531 [Caerostris extrusa]|uniref:Uncharacterized protein n=1 Tax=Caerostris extrusa TaxID=172846 RepID=A0AAV4RXE5_CAEEX|nr:hypothetical protein CEXT_243531 [Caerostris extrusa]
MLTLLIGRVLINVMPSLARGHILFNLIGGIFPEGYLAISGSTAKRRLVTDESETGVAATASVFFVGDGLLTFRLILRRFCYSCLLRKLAFSGVGVSVTTFLSPFLSLVTNKFVRINRENRFGFALSFYVWIVRNSRRVPVISYTQAKPTSSNRTCTATTWEPPHGPGG